MLVKQMSRNNDIVDDQYEIIILLLHSLQTPSTGQARPVEQVCMATDEPGQSCPPNAGAGFEQRRFNENTISSHAVKC